MENKHIELMPGQSNALARLLRFVDSNDKVFILKGYAGTGKTTLVKELINKLNEKDCNYVLLASTGRAAKILANKTDKNTSTVHGLVYEYSGFNQDIDQVLHERKTANVDKTGQLLLMFEPSRITSDNQNIYIVDEASMISDAETKNAEQAMFGNGRLLNDLLQYDTDGKYIFIGDACQLPPVNQRFSPALTAQYFSSTFGIDADGTELTEIVRQAKGNDIVVAAQKLRRLFFAPQPWKWAKFPLRGCKNIHLVNNSSELMQLYINDIKKNGCNASTMITFSNRQCDIATKLIRPSLGIMQSTIAVDDILLVTQNNLLSGLMNGDIVQIVEIGKEVHRAGLTFVMVSVKELFTKKVFSQLMIADIVYSNQTNLFQEQQKELFVDFFIRMKAMGIALNSKEFREHMQKDNFLNALRCVFGYVLTCHKSQGGEWENVYLNIPRNLPLQPKPYVYQWIYTAMTRASKDLYVVDDFYIM